MSSDRDSDDSLSDNKRTDVRNAMGETGIPQVVINFLEGEKKD